MFYTPGHSFHPLVKPSVGLIDGHFGVAEISSRSSGLFIAATVAMGKVYNLAMGAIGSTAHVMVFLGAACWLLDVIAGLQIGSV